MSRILTVTFATLMLAGCADTYDKAAVPKVAAGLRQETVACKTRWTEKQIKTYSEWQACQLTAERDFARTINLTTMDTFEVYAADIEALAADRDAHRVTDRQIRSRAQEIQWKFFADCGCEPGRHPATWTDSGPGMGIPSGDVPNINAVRVDNSFEAPH